MLISLNYRDARPIYEQVKDSLRIAVISGAMSAGEKLPSVRELAMQLSVNPNTIQRAYRELESEGYICSVAGKGSFVAERGEEDSARRSELMRRLTETAEELRFLGVSTEELCELIKHGGENK